MKSNWFAHARLLLGVVVLLAAGTLATRARHGMETDLYALADVSDGGVLRELADGMAGQGGVLLEGDDFEALKTEAESIRARFRQPAGDFKDTLKFLAAHRAGLLSPEAREQLMAGRYKDVADAALARLYGFLPPLVSVKEDPFLLATDWLLSLQMKRAAGWTLRDGLLARETNGVQQVLLTLDLSAVRPQEIANFLEAVAKSLPGSSLETSTNLDVEAPSAQRQTLTWCGGPPFHAARATANATREINVLSAASLALVLLFGWLLFRSFRFVPQLVATLGVAFLVAAAALFAAFPRPHVLTFVFGTSLIGLAVDYVYHTRAAGDVRRVLRPLALSLLTTEACFAPLLFSVVPVLRQMALFTGSGLLAAFAWAVAWGWKDGDKRQGCCFPDGICISDGVGGIGEAALSPLRLLLVAVAVCGLCRVRVSSDPASFYTPDRYLAESEKRLAACSTAETGRFVFVRGKDVQEALEREEAAGIQGLSAFVPSLARQRENAALVAKLCAAEGSNYCARTGLRVAVPQKEALLDPDKVDDPYLAQMVRAMKVEGGIVSPCPEGFASDDPNIVILEPKWAVGDLFAAFSAATMRLLGWSLAVLAVLLAAVFGRRSLGYVASLAATFAATAGMLGWLGVPVTFFTLLCFFAVAGLGLDYAIFSRGASAPSARRTVFFAFLTSFAGLGMLSFTDFAVTRAMGVTFACGLFFAWLCADLFASGRGANGHAGRGTLPDAPDGNEQAGRGERPARPHTRQTHAWHQQREQSAGRWRMLFMWYAYVLFGKTFQKLVCVPVMVFIYPFARPAREALHEFYAVLRAYVRSRGTRDHAGEQAITNPRSPIFTHLLGFAWSLADKTDACTLRKNLPRMSVRDDAGWRAFDSLVKSKKGAFLLSTHLGTIEVFPALGDDSPHVHAFQQMGHDAVFTEVFARHLDASRLTLHPVEEIGVETAVRMQEAIGRGELVLMAGDRVSAGSDRVLRHDFLGRQCVWPKGAFVFAKLMEAPVFFVTCVRTGWNAYEVHMREFMLPEGQFLQSLLDAYVRFLEEETLAHPEQWYQFYRFFSPIAT